MHIKNEQGVLYLMGEVSIHTLTHEVWQQLHTHLNQSVHEVNCASITRSDSAALSVMLEILRIKGTTVRFTFLPSSLLDLTQLYEIEKWIQ